MRAAFVSTAATASAATAAIASLLLAAGTTHALIIPAYNSNAVRVGCKTLLHSGRISQARQLQNRQPRAVPLTCELERLPPRTLRRVAPQGLTLTKCVAACLGQTSAGDRHHGSRIVDSVSLIFVVWFVSFFASRTLLIAFSTSGSIAWRACGLIAFMRAVWAPLMETHNRSAELWGDKSVRNRTRGALFTGRVTKTGFALASEASDHRNHFQMLVEDEEGRELLFDVPRVPEYRQIRRGMRCEVVVLSRSKDFSDLTGVTEAYLPELDLFVGRFSLLDKRAFWGLLQARDERERRELIEGNSKIKSQGRREPVARGETERSTRHIRGREYGRGAREWEKDEQPLRKRNSKNVRERATMAGDW